MSHTPKHEHMESQSTKNFVADASRPGGNGFYVIVSYHHGPERDHNQKVFKGPTQNIIHNASEEFMKAFLDWEEGSGAGLTVIETGKDRSLAVFGVRKDSKEVGQGNTKWHYHEQIYDGRQKHGDKWATFGGYTSTLRGAFIMAHAAISAAQSMRPEQDDAVEATSAFKDFLGFCLAGQENKR